MRSTLVRARRLATLLLALSVLSAVVALPASAKQLLFSTAQSITNDSGANLCVWGQSYVDWVAGDTYVATTSFTKSDNYGCSVSRNLSGSTMLAEADLWKGGWPNVVLCQTGATAFNPWPSSDEAYANYVQNTCGQNTTYWNIGSHQLYVWPGTWYPNPAMNTIAGPSNGTCDPNCY